MSLRARIASLIRKVAYRLADLAELVDEPRFVILDDFTPADRPLLANPWQRKETP